MMSMQSRRFCRCGAAGRRRSVTTLVLAALAFSAGPAAAAPGNGCVSVNSGAFDAELSSAGSLTREVVLDAGDILDLSVRAAQGATASVMLIGGAGAPQALVGNSSAAAVTFRAPQGEAYTFRFTAADGGRASLSATCTSTHAAAASAAFLARRKDLLNAQGPERTRLGRAPTPIANPEKPLSSNVALDNNGDAKQVEFSVSLSELTAASDPRKKPDPGLLDFWLEGRMNNYDAESADLGVSRGNLGVLYFGTSTLIGPDIKTGALVQLDRGIETAKYGSSEMAATGWMAGPYLSMKLASGVVFDGRAAWGETENALAGADSDIGQIDRRLVRAKLTGTRQVRGWNVAPSVGLVYLEDAVRDGETGEMKAAGTGQVEVLPEVSRRFDVGSDTFIEPRAAVGGFVGFDEFSALNQTITTDGIADLHLKAEAGVAVGVKDGSTLKATGGVESGDTAASENWMGRLQLNVPLGK